MASSVIPFLAVKMKTVQIVLFLKTQKIYSHQYFHLIDI